MANRGFPDGFIWGVATSAQQIEGGRHEAGRGESIWDRFADTPGNIDDGSRPDVACDHYGRWREDIGLISDLGVGAYRFSISWPRILPNGRGEVNRAGLDFYDSLVDGLLEAGVQPYPTLYHWDLPQALQDRGGWAERDTVEAFVEYSSAVIRRLGDRIEHWVTHNEPWCIAMLGHEEGHHAPGHRDPAEALRVAHHLLLSHGRATEAIRSEVPGSKVGLVNIHVPVHAASDSPADVDAARWLDGFFNRWYLDPVFRGVYPDDVIADRVALGHLEGPELPFVKDGDLTAISTPLDFLGINYYSRALVEAGPDGLPKDVKAVAPEELTDMGWEVYPAGLEESLLRLHRDYGPKEIHITENGAAYDVPVDASGRIPDTKRIDYLREHIVATHRAILQGVPLKAYFAWSLMDNFEWGHGYEKRFGLYAVDFETRQRIPKDSVAWFREVVSSNAVAPEVTTDTREASRATEIQ